MAAVALTVINCVLSFTALFFSISTANGRLNAQEIYSRSLNSVVEVKAVSENVGESFGTGEIISSDGKIVTNAHVVTYTRAGAVKEFDNYFVRFAFEEEYREVSLEKYQTENDLAVLKFKRDFPSPAKPVKCGESNKVRSGDVVYAVGNASNYGIGVFRGIVSVPYVNIEIDNITRRVIQCDLTIAAGNSGGALLNEHGELVGITTFRTKDNSGNVIYGIVYCIPVNTVLEFTKD